MATSKAAAVDALKPVVLSSARQRLSTDSVPDRDRFSYWTDMVCAMYARLECDQPELGAMQGQIEFSALGSMRLTHVLSNAPAVRRTPSLIESDPNVAYLVQLQRRGHAIVLQDGRQARLAPGDFVLYDTGKPYELLFPEPAHEVVVIGIARSELEPHVMNLGDLTATTVPGSSAAGNLLLMMIDTLMRDIDRLHPSSALGISEGITSIVAAGLRSLPGANLRQSSALGTYHITRVKAYVMENLRNPALSIASIANAMKLSPDHLSRLFRSEPVPLSRLIWKERLDACRRDLADPRLATRSITDIAFSWGFNDAAHFSRSFKEQFGFSPRDWRLQRVTMNDRL